MWPPCATLIVLRVFALLATFLVVKRRREVIQVVVRQARTNRAATAVGWRALEAPGAGLRHSW